MSTQLMHQQLLATIIEKILNKALALNINSNAPLAELAEKTLTLQLKELGFPLSFTVSDQQVLVTGLHEQSDCLLTADIKSLKELQKHQQLTELIKQEKLDISGDLKVAQHFAALFENLTIDWQSELAKHIGDIPTYKLTQFSQWLSGKLQFAASQIQADASEWLVHEKQWLVTASQIERFSQQVTQLNQQLNQLELRMSRIEDALAATAPLKDISNCE